MLVPVVALTFLFRPKNATRTGIQGWLAFLAVWLVCLDLDFVSLLIAAIRQRQQLARIEGGLVVYYADVARYACLSLWAALTARALFTMRAAFVPMFDLLWRMCGGFIVLDGLVVCLFTDTGPNDFLTSRYFWLPTTVFITLGFWRLYTRRSARVRNTMVH